MNKFTTTRVRRLAGLAIIVSICIGASVPAATAASAHPSSSATTQICGDGTPWEIACT